MLAGTSEIFIPHDPTRGALKAVRRMLVQGSHAELRELGLFERYCDCIRPNVLEALKDQSGPGWLPVELAMEHYQACDLLGLSDPEIERIAALAGGRRAWASLASGGTKTPDGTLAPWELVSACWRMGRRLFEGGSAQYVKLGPQQLLIENHGMPLLSIHYYRTAHIAFLRSAFASLGVQVTEAKLTMYRASNAATEVRLSWV